MTASPRGAAKSSAPITPDEILAGFEGSVARRVRRARGSYPGRADRRHVDEVRRLGATHGRRW
jgi:hypothetical protein